MYIFLFLLLVLLLIELITLIYRKKWSENLTVEITFENNGIFEGGNGKIFQIIINRKLLPFWWGDIQYTIPPFIKIDDMNYKGREYYKNTVSAFSYERVKKTIPFTALKRGYYKITEAELITQDMFFSYKFIKEYSENTELYVYPNIKSIQNLDINFKKLIGEVIARRHFIEDPFELRGIRDYYPFDSLKNINWNATAKTGEIKVNEYNHTSSQEVIIMLDFDSQKVWDKQDIKEDIIRIGAFIASQLIAQGISIGMSSNTGDIETHEELMLPCRNGNNQLISIYRLLARLNTEILTRPFTELLEIRAAKSSNRPQYIVISFNHRAELSHKIRDLTSASNSLQWILLCEKDDICSVEYQSCLTICEVKY